MILFLRFIVALLSVCGLLPIAAALVGHQLPTTVLIGSIRSEDSTYIEYLDDTARGFRLSLAGTRCYNPFPRQYYIALHEAGNWPVEQHEWSSIFENMSAADAIVWLACD